MERVYSEGIAIHIARHEVTQNDSCAEPLLTAWITTALTSDCLPIYMRLVAQSWGVGASAFSGKGSLQIGCIPLARCLPAKFHRASAKTPAIQVSKGWTCPKPCKAMGTLEKRHP